MKQLPVTKREFIIHLMAADNIGHNLKPLNDHYLARIATAFGGFTVTEGRGGWIDDKGNLFDEAILRVTIAINNTPEASAKLKQIALNYKQEAKQLSVYMVGMDGVVLFV